MNLGTMSASVPACRKCARRYWWQFWLRWLIPLACMIVAGQAVMFAVGVRFRLLDKNLLTLISLGVFALAALPWWLWDRCFPLPIEFVPEEEGIEYKIRDSAYFFEFLDLNTPDDDLPLVLRKMK